VLLAFYDFPAEHWKHLRTTNPIESTFVTVRRRTIRTRHGNCHGVQIARGRSAQLAKVRCGHSSAISASKNDGWLAVVAPMWMMSHC
jgi:Transposase, Mutator family